jgi:hypothetical protein
MHHLDKYPKTVPPESSPTIDPFWQGKMSIGTHIKTVDMKYNDSFGIPFLLDKGH